MTLQDVKDCLAHIKKIRSDDEMAHVSEDALYKHVLDAIAMGAPNPAELAGEALKARNIDFSRWCA